MTKKLVAMSLAIALVITLGLAPVAYAAKPTQQLLDSVEIGNTGVSGFTLSPAEANHGLDGWGPTEPETSGGNYGEIALGTCRVVWYEDETGDEADNRCATLTLSWSAGKARHIKMSVLDGFADDSFNVYVENPGGNWALVYSYTDTPPAWDSEMWFVHDIYSFPAGKGQGPSIDMKIEATGDEWNGFVPFGQLAVDWVKVYDH